MVLRITGPAKSVLEAKPGPESSEVEELEQKSQYAESEETERSKAAEYYSRFKVYARKIQCASSVRGGRTLEVGSFWDGETAWKAQICLLTEKDPNEEVNIPEEVLNAVTPLVWALKTPGRAKNATPVKIELKPGAQPVRKKQYPIKLEARKGLEPIISSFLERGLLRECQSEFNTPILPVKKPRSSEYRLVQGCREINARTADVHPVVPNPYTLLTTIPNSNTYSTDSTVLDLKDAFFCIPVDEQSQTIFAFEWENPSTGRKTQLCWTVLPQGFKNSPTLFGKVLAKELERWQNDHDAVTLLQYVDDLLIGSDSYEAGLEATISLLNFLGLAGYRVSKKKAQTGKKRSNIWGLKSPKDREN
ncbi:hypothetical protein QYF61_013381 [Mycteria americana]|uniref:ribonuclease H n=1 Tax=Mycteria americana TaxID=33587 RepID=A0AAN7RJ92_MYCAM|nr:hypothetical protein QYF61_013381 [Mycteria americana]